MRARELFLAAGVGLAGAVLSHGAWAGPKIFTSGSAILTVNGSTETTANGNPDPFLAEVFTSGRECLRIAVTAQGADLKATLLSPAGTVWQDDDGNGHGDTTRIYSLYVRLCLTRRQGPPTR